MGNDMTAKFNIGMKTHLWYGWIAPFLHISGKKTAVNIMINPKTADSQQYRSGRTEKHMRGLKLNSRVQDGNTLKWDHSCTRSGRVSELGGEHWAQDEQPPLYISEISETLKWFHVTAGVLFLSVALIRVFRDSLTTEHHLE